MKVQKNYLAAILCCTFILLFTGQAQAVINGPCAACHTMHNSQGNSPMRFDNGSTPLPELLRGDCYGCHAQGGAQALVPVGVDVIPQVYHKDGIELAGGNFAYLDDFKSGGTGNPDARGHNINGLGGITSDATLYGPPGGIKQFGHDDGFVINTDLLTCAGNFGCHGVRRDRSAIPYNGITGAHHDNVNGSVIQAVTDGEPGHGYRFLQGVNGYEDTDWQFTKTNADHNEYFGRTTPAQLGCDGAELSCHNTAGGRGVRPPNGTMAEYCGTCHGNFHTLETVASSGIGPNTSSPFIRHPNDLSLPNVGEYTAYTTYLVNTPVARIAVPGGSGSGVNATDAVFCLSCHVAHGSMYPDMLKWDYAAMQVGNGGAATGKGCFACHSTKD